MTEPPGGPQTPHPPPPPPPPPALNCWLWGVVSAESIRFFGVLQGLNYVLPPTGFNPLWAVRVVTKFTSETFNRRVEKFFRRCCSCYVVRPRLRCPSLPVRPKYVQKSWCCIYQWQIGDGYWKETPTSRLATLTARRGIFPLWHVHRPRNSGTLRRWYAKGCGQSGQGHVCRRAARQRCPSNQAQLSSRWQCHNFLKSAAKYCLARPLSSVTVTREKNPEKKSPAKKENTVIELVNTSRSLQENLPVWG